MSSENAIRASELENYDFGSIEAPEGFDPDARGWENTPPGWHIFEIPRTDGFTIVPNHPFKGRDFGVWYGNQLRPRLVVPEGQPAAGTSTIDFIPMPTPGEAMPRTLANQWANFIGSFGFRPPAGKLVPPGFKLHDLAGARAWAEVVLDTYDPDNPKLKVRYFGYRPLNDPPAAVATRRSNNGSASRNNGGASRKAASSSTPQSESKLDLDEL